LFIPHGKTRMQQIENWKDYYYSYGYPIPLLTSVGATGVPPVINHRRDACATSKGEAHTFPPLQGEGWVGVGCV
jgi:hypothetical protein